MTTSGKTWRTRGGLAFPLAPYGDVSLAELPALIDELEAVRGEQLLVEAPVDLPIANRRLLASLGVAVRFVDEPRDPPRRRVPPPPRADVEQAVRRAVDASPGDVDPLARRALAWLAEA